MEKQTSFTLGAALALLMVAGLFLDNKKLLKLMNVDITHSIVRLPISAALLYGGSVDDLHLTRKVLFGAGLIYMAIGTAGLKDRKLGGLLPHGLTNFDLVYHFAVGTEILWLGSRSGRMMKPKR